MNPARREVLASLFERLYGGPVIRNDLRGELVEEIVGMALVPDWSLCGSDWGACDLRDHNSGLRIQVKQSAALQSWLSGKSGYGPPRYSIAAKTGFFEGADWIADHGRNAEIFIFAWHDVTGDECDHAEPEQWRFYVVAEADLPAQKSFGLRQITRLAVAVDFSGLKDAIGVMKNQILSNASSARSRVAGSVNSSSLNT